MSTNLCNKTSNMLGYSHGAITSEVQQQADEQHLGAVQPLLATQRQEGQRVQSARRRRGLAAVSEIFSRLNSITNTVTPETSKVKDI